MSGGLIVLVVVLAAASLAGALLRRRQGRFSQGRRQAASPLPGGAGPSPGAKGRERGTDPAASRGHGAPGTVLTSADLGAPLGERATLVQFSTEFCAYCGPTRELLAEVATERAGVAFVEVDAVQRMDLARRLRVLATPTILVLGADGAIESRASGKPRKPDLLAAVGAVLGRDGSR